MTSALIGGPLGEMMARHAAAGQVQCIYTRAQRRETVSSVTDVDVTEDGLVGDHGRKGKRAVTLFQTEHLAVIAALLGQEVSDARPLRRNLVVSGINLVALRGREISVGTCRLFVHGPCPPCSRMEETFGPGGYSAVRGHGGVYAEVTHHGHVAIGSTVLLSPPD